MLDSIQWLYDAAFLWMAPLTFHKCILMVMPNGYNGSKSLKDDFMCKMWLDVTSTMRRRFLFSFVTQFLTFSQKAICWDFSKNGAICASDYALVVNSRQTGWLLNPLSTPFRLVSWQTPSNLYKFIQLSSTIVLYCHGGNPWMVPCKQNSRLTLSYSLTCDQNSQY